MPAPVFTGIAHLDLSVSDIDASAEWYEKVLGLRNLHRAELDGRTMVVMLAGAARMIIGLNQHDGRPDGRFDERRVGLDHVGFEVPERADLDEWQRHLAALDVEHQAEMAALQAEAGGADVPMRVIEDMAFIEAQLGDWRAEYGLEGDLAQQVTEGERSFELSLRRLAALDELAGLQDGALSAVTGSGGAATPAPVPRSSKRDAMRGSAWKRKASLHARQLLKGGLDPAAFDEAGRKMIEALKQSTEAYRASEGFPGSANFNLYMALNRLTLDALTDWATPAAKDAALVLVQQCRQLAHERAERSDDAWDAMMPSDALLTQRLLEGSLGRADEVGTATFEELAAAYEAAFSSVAVKPAQLYAVVKQLEIMSRFCDALSLVQQRDEALRRTADRLLQLVQRIQPRRGPRGDRPANPVDWTPAAAPPDARPKRRAAPPAKKAAAKKAAPRKAAARKAAARKR